MPKIREKTFVFIGHRFDFRRGRATFYYKAPSGRHFTERIDFDCPPGARDSVNRKALSRALDLALFLIGTSYYKADPTTKIITRRPISTKLANLLNATYQEGLSQYAFENNLTRDDLAHFEPRGEQNYWRQINYEGQGIIAPQSGGKDSLLVATELTEAKKPFRPVYVSYDSTSHPDVLNELGKPLTVIRRQIDRKNLKKAGGLNGHIPITYIIYSIALIQAILYNYNQISAGIGDEGAEPHATIGDLEVRHQWAKTQVAEDLINDFIQSEISSNLEIRSPLRGRSELKIAEDFTKKCWAKFGHSFSSCNVANYTQGGDNHKLKWCSSCAKCANAYLLFAPFLPAEELNNTIGSGKDLFADPSLSEIFKGLLGIDGVMKPFECIGSIDELRRAYELKNPALADLPFTVPKSDFPFEKEA